MKDFHIKRVDELNFEEFGIDFDGNGISDYFLIRYNNGSDPPEALALQQSAASFQGTGGNPNIVGFQDHVINVYQKQNNQKIFVDVTFGSQQYTDFETYLNGNTYIKRETGQIYNSNYLYPYKNNTTTRLKYIDLFDVLNDENYNENYDVF